jgi:hypothetical protein
VNAGLQFLQVRTGVREVKALNHTSGALLVEPEEPHQHRLPESEVRGCPPPPLRQHGSGGGVSGSRSWPCVGWLKLWSCCL